MNNNDIARCAGYGSPALDAQCQTCARRLIAEQSSKAPFNAWASWVEPSKVNPCPYRIVRIGKAP